MPTPAAKPTAARDDVHDSGRGRHADKPSELPKQGWLDVLSRTVSQISADNLSIVAAGVAFYAFVAIVPALAAMIAIYGLVSNPSDVMQHIESMGRVLPRDVMPILHDQMTRITQNTGSASLSALLGVLIAIYSSANATKALISGLNIAYGDTEKRNFLKLSLLALMLTVGLILGAILAVGLVAVLPAVLNFLHLGGTAETMLNILRWPLLLGGFITALAMMYRFGPCRERARWRWVTWGAVVAAVLWVLASGAFSLYVSKFGSYDKTYGSLGAVVVFLMWLYLSAFAVLIGAELNAEMERQTAKDTTRGEPEPLGERGAHAADTVGPARERKPPKQKA